MKIAIAAILILGLGFDQDDPGECCKESSKAHYCEKCRKILADADGKQVDFDGDVFTSCKACAKANGDDVTAYAKARAVEIEVCARTYYECAGEGDVLGCGKIRREPGECCGKERAKKTHRSRIYYVCSECSKQWGHFPLWRIAEWQQPGNHGNGMLKDKPGECQRHNCRLEPRCSLEGVFPHVPVK